MSENISTQFSLKGKTALITGASRGIGKAIAYTYGLAGAKVLLASRKIESLNAVATEFGKAGISTDCIAVNMGKMNELELLVAEVNEKHGGIDILVNNAATNPVFGPVQNTDERAFDKIIDVNVKGPFFLAKAFYETMKARGGGSIINISSIGGISPEQGLGIYSVSKASLISLTKVLAREWGRDQIRANVICPGLIKTDFSQPLWDNEKVLNGFMKMVPLKRVGEPEEVAGLALLLASDAGAYTTGSVFTVDGGFTV